MTTIMVAGGVAALILSVRYDQGWAATGLFIVVAFVAARIVFSLEKVDAAKTPTVKPDLTRDRSIGRTR